MKIVLLIVSFSFVVCSCLFSQVRLDISVGNTHAPLEQSINRKGFYVSLSPSFAVNPRFRFRPSLQYRKLIFKKSFGTDAGNIDLSPEFEFKLFDFLSLGAGVYYSYSLNQSELIGFKPFIDLGPVGYVKFEQKKIYAIIRYIKPVIDEISESIGSANSVGKYAYKSGTFHFGFGYTFGKD